MRFINGVVVLFEFYLNLQVRKNDGEVTLLDRELEFSSRLKNFIAFRGFTDLGFDVQEAVTGTNVGFVGVLLKGNRFRPAFCGLERAQFYRSTCCS